MKIGVVLGSIRQGRFGAQVAEWTMENLPAVDGVEVELLDLKSFNVPLLTVPTVPGAAQRKYSSDEVRAWSAAIDSCDGFLFVTAEYNHSIPGAFKNALDSLGPEWWGKAVGFISYGADGGIRAVEHWRTVVANMGMTDVRAQLPIYMFNEKAEDGTFTPNSRRAAELSGLYEQVLDATRRNLGNRR